MDKYEYNLKLDQMKSLYADEKYEEAADIADTMNWTKVKNPAALLRAGEIYEKTERYADSKEVLLMAYDRSPIGRGIIYRLAEVAVKMQDFQAAQEYYDEFVEIAPHDNLKYVLRYDIRKAQGAPYTELIPILEELKEEEYTEEWAYELAYLYHKAGMSEKCIDACDELILWFGDGPYVERALELKMLYQPLTKTQEEKYRSFRQARDGYTHINIEEMQQAGEYAHEPVSIPQVAVSSERYNTVNLQEEIARGMQQIIDATEKSAVADSLDNINKIVEDIPYLQLPKDTPETPGAHIETDEEIDGSLKINFQEMLGEDSDGQISLRMDERMELEHQITGQITIEEVLDEWERTKRAAEAAMQEAEQRKLESAKARALQHAGNIMDRLTDVIPKLDAGVTPRELLEEEYLQGGSEGLNPQADMPAAGSMTEESAGVQPELSEFAAGDYAQTAEELPVFADEIYVGAEQELPEAELEEHPELEGIEESALGVPEAGQEDGTGTEPELPEARLEDDLRLEEMAKSASGVPGIGLEDGTGTEPELPEAGLEDDLGLEEMAERALEAPRNGLEADLGAETKLPEAEFEVISEEELLESAGMQDSEMFNQDLQTKEADMPEGSADEPEDVEEPPQKEPEPEKRSFRKTAEERAKSGIDKWKTKTIRMPEIKLPEDLNAEDDTEEPAPIEKLTDEQRTIFSYFMPVKGMESQLCKALTGITQHLAKDKTASTGNLVIQGGHGCGKTTLATSIIKVLQQQGEHPNEKIGKIQAEALNRKDVGQLLKKVAGGCLIIENIGELTRQTMITLSLLLEQDSSGVLIIVEDTSKGIKKAFSQDDSFARKFTETISVPIFTNDELVAFARSYSKELGYEIDEMAVLALYNRISKIQRLDQATTLTEVKDIVDEAIEREARGGIKKYFSILTASRYTDDDRIVLKEKDFE